MGSEVNDIMTASNFNDWIFKSALPPQGTFDFSTPKGVEAEELAYAYIALNGTGHPDNYQDYFSFYSNLKVIFYETLAANMQDMNTVLLTQIDNDYNATADPDPEVKQRWLPIGLTI